MNSFSSAEINPNLRFDQDLTAVDLVDDFVGTPVIGGLVDVYERTSGLRGRGWVHSIDHENREVIIFVDWANLRLPDASATAHPLTAIESNFVLSGLPVSA